jgi:hypothetical protein
MSNLLKTEWQRFKKYMKDERGFLNFALPFIASAVGGAISSKTKQGSSGASASQTSSYQPTAGQAAVDALIQRLSTQGADPYTGQRVAPLTGNEQALQGTTRQILDSSAPAIARILQGGWGPDQESYFNAAVADPTRRQFEQRVAPAMNENAALTGNRFADRTAIQKGQAYGDVESGILQKRGEAAQESYYAPLKYGPSAAATLGGFEDIFQTERNVNQAQDDANYNEFLRTNPYAGGLLTSLLTGYAGTPKGSTTVDATQTNSAQAPGFDYGKLIGRAINSFGPQLLGSMGVR